MKSILNQRAAMLLLAMIFFVFATIRIFWHPFRDNSISTTKISQLLNYNRTSLINFMDTVSIPSVITMTDDQTTSSSLSNAKVATSKLASKSLNTIDIVSVKPQPLPMEEKKIIPPTNSVMTPAKNNRTNPEVARIIQHDKRIQSHKNLFTSPSEGTDISLNPQELLKAYNQTQAIIPQLQVAKDYKVYFCNHKENGVRFFFLIREGLLLHPRIHMVSDPAQADYIVYLPVSAGWHETECNQPSYRAKTIILDEGDGPGLFTVDDNAGKWFLYFKRSFVSRHKGIFQGYMKYVHDGNVFPMTYSSGDIYVKPQYNTYDQRDLEIVCTLRGSNHDPVRLRVREWIEEYVKARGIKNAVAGQVNHESRRTISKEYFNNMYRAKIIVTSNPSGWEGDFRFCEALSSGALIFIDHMYVPRPNPFIHNQHIVYYDNNNKTDLFDKLDFYRLSRQVTQRVAMQGYLHAMKHHRAVNLVDYVFRTVHTKELTSPQASSNLRGGMETIIYKQTGYDILKIAQDRAKKYSLHDGR